MFSSYLCQNFLIDDIHLILIILKNSNTGPEWPSRCLTEKISASREWSLEPYWEDKGRSQMTTVAVNVLIIFSGIDQCSLSEICVMSISFFMFYIYEVSGFMIVYNDRLYWNDWYHFTRISTVFRKLIPIIKLWLIKLSDTTRINTN